MKRLFVAVSVLALFAMTGYAAADTIEGASGGTVNATFDLTINPDGSVSATATGFDPFDDLEDTGFDVLNNSAAPVSSLAITSPTAFGVFAFDSDGIDTIVTPNPSPTIDTTGYAGPGGNFFSNISTDGIYDFGVINFGPPIAPGGTNYFSLEGPAIFAPGLTSITTNNTPLPSAALMGLAGIAGAAFVRLCSPKPFSRS